MKTHARKLMTSVIISQPTNDTLKLHINYNKDGPSIGQAAVSAGLGQHQTSIPPWLSMKCVCVSVR